MNKWENIFNSLGNTSIGKAVRNMESFYEDTDKTLSEFSQKEDIACPLGCGLCCFRFLPDITKLESLYLAAYISVSERKDEIQRRLEGAKEQKNGPCPLFDSTKEYHCMCYQARPLICRLFASSCFPGKNGERKFSRCHLNPHFKGPENIIEGDCPIMGDYGQRMISIEENDSYTEFLPVRVLKDIALIEYYQKLSTQK